MPNGRMRGPFAAKKHALDVVLTTSGPRTASSAPRPYIGYITSQWHTRQPQSLEQLAAISWCRSHAERMAGAALINHGGTVIYQHVRVARPPSPSILPSVCPCPLALASPVRREAPNAERGRCEGRASPSCPPPSTPVAAAILNEIGWVIRRLRRRRAAAP